MTRVLLANAELLDPESAAPQRAALLLEDGRIAAKLPPGDRSPAGARRIDCAGLRIAPGFLDLHFHGGLVFAADGRFGAALAAASRSLARTGTTAFLATSVAWPAPALERRVAELAGQLANAAFEGAVPIGLHLEGPWINPQAAGAQPAEALRGFDAAEGAAVLDAGAGCVRMVTCAPEVEGAKALLALLGERGVVAALGHSAASAADVEDAASRGATHVTHLFNAMGGLHHRDPGVVGAALADDRLSCDLICDGVHVHPAVVRVAARAKRTRLALITDRIDVPAGAADGAAPGFGSGAVHDDGAALRLADGRLAGSRLALDVALRNAISFADLAICEAIAACTLRPARVLGLEREYGTLRPGARADLALLDADLRVRETWVGGRRVASADAG